jgi:hypothetical protein
MRAQGDRATVEGTSHRQGIVPSTLPTSSASEGAGSEVKGLCRLKCTGLHSPVTSSRSCIRHDSGSRPHERQSWANGLRMWVRLSLEKHPDQDGMSSSARSRALRVASPAHRSSGLRTVSTVGSDAPAIGPPLRSNKSDKKCPARTAERRSEAGHGGRSNVLCVSSVREPKSAVQRRTGGRLPG